MPKSSKEKEVLVISGFPGIGKSWLQGHNDKIVLADTGSTPFFWSDETRQHVHPEWPHNYWHLITKLRETPTVNTSLLLIATNKEIRELLLINHIHFFLVYPKKTLKSEYIERYKKRRSPDWFLAYMIETFELTIEDLARQKGCTHLVLDRGKYLSDVIPQLMS